MEYYREKRVVVIGSDHGAYKIKEFVKKYLTAAYYEVIDVGTTSESSCNYPDYAIAVVKEMKKRADKNAKGILLCGSGIGVSMCANRFKGIRAALCRSIEDAILSRMHNDANVLCIGGRKAKEEDIEQLLDAWFGAFYEGGRHVERIAIFNDLGEPV